jgi:hypothetical protein
MKDAFGVYEFVKFCPHVKMDCITRFGYLVLSLVNPVFLAQIYIEN